MSNVTNDPTRSARSRAARTRSDYAIQLAKHLADNDLTPEDIAERRHAWYHLKWSSGKAATMPDKHSGVCRLIVAETPGAVRARLRMTEANYAKRTSLPPAAQELREYEIFATIAHASAHMEDVFPALAVEYAKVRAENVRKVAEKAQADRRQPLETGETIASMVWNYDGHHKELDMLMFHALDGLDLFEIRVAFNRIAAELHNTFPERPHRAPAEVTA